MSQDRFLALAKQSEQLRDQLDQVREELNAAMADLGVGKLLQDPETGTVYKVVKPQGTFIYYRDIDYVRTAQEGERAGTLSKKEAEAAGFVLKKS